MAETTLNMMKEKLEEGVRASTMESLGQLKAFYYQESEHKQYLKELVHEYETHSQPETKLFLAVCAYLQLDWNLLETLLADLPQNEMTTLMKVACLWNQERFTEALDAFASYLKKNPHPELELLYTAYQTEREPKQTPKILKKYEKLVSALEKIADKEEEEVDSPERRQQIMECVRKELDPRCASHLLYFLGRVSDNDGYYITANLYYKSASELNPLNPFPLFRLGYNTGLRGEEKEAIHFYEKCVQIQPPHINALINLGVLYEDSWKFEEALNCFNTVLKRYPNHKRARLYLADCISSKSMCFDEDMERRNDRSLQILKTPVSDFELSVRSRNCLERMNIITLGDLVKKSEAELLSYKNFGETSLTEIKEMLTKLGLKLGQTEPLIIESPKKKSLKKLQNVEDDALLSKAITEIDFSVRARKAMTRLKINTLRDLVSRSETELMSIKNFGQTSLTNVKQKLTQHGLKLAESK